MKTILQVNDQTESRDEDYAARCKLASMYRLVDLKGWTFSIYNHITIRCENTNNFLINPFGLHYSEVTASNLIKIDEHGNVIDRGTSSYGVNKAGFILHSTIHAARPDINAIIHLHTGLAAGLSTLKIGLLPITQEALSCGHVSYHDYEGILVDDSERERIVKDLGGTSKIMILRNHGVVACGSTLEEAWFYLFNFMAAADNQFHAMAAVGGDASKLVFPHGDVLQRVQKVFEGGRLSTYTRAKDAKEEWQMGELELEMEMRRMDYLGYNTGYPYKKTTK